MDLSPQEVSVGLRTERPWLFGFLTAVISLGSHAHAQVSAGGWGTRVNGSQFGTCRVGQCAVQGGTGAGDNLFHRFGRFDTRFGLEEVRIDTSGRGNVFLSVTNSAGTFLNVPLTLSSTANLFLLSPGGLWLGQGGQFNKVPNLLLSTGIALNLPGGRWDALQSHPSELKELRVGPALRFDPVATPAGSSLVVGARGGGSIVIDRALLDVRGGLIVDAASGPLTLRQSQLSAGNALRLSGRGFTLLDSTLKAGEPGNRGPIEIRSSPDPLSGSYGSGLIERVRMSGNQINISAGSLRLLDSRITAPKGWVELQTTNPTGQSSDLALIGTQIDLNPATGWEAWKPQILRRQRSDGTVQELWNPTPHIGLFSRGALQIERSLLDASLRLPSGSEPAPEMILAALPVRSGLIFAEATGNININASSLRADASHTLAGYVWMEAGRDLKGEISLGELLIRDSQLSTSFGAGAGSLLLQADDGLTVQNSSLSAVIDRWPLVTGFEPKDGLRPTFFGGQILLFNQSETKPLLVSSSTIAATHHSAGGPLASPFLSPNLDNSGIGAFGSALDGWINGVSESYSGGFLQIYSKGGLRVSAGSLLDVSGRNPSSGQIEPIAGSLALLNSGQAPTEILGSRLDARNGTIQDSGEVDYKAGRVSIYGKSDIQLVDAKVDVTAANPIPNDSILNEPYIEIISSGRLKIAGASFLVARPDPPGHEGDSLGTGEPVSDPVYGVFLRDALSDKENNQEVSLSRMIVGKDVVVDPAYIESPEVPRDAIEQSTSAILGDLNRFIVQNRIVFDRAYTASGLTQAAWLMPLPSPPPSYFLPQDFPQQPTATTGEVAMATEAQPDAAQELVEGQQRALADAVASLGLPSESGRVRSVEELQRRLLRIQQSTPGNPVTTQPAQKPSLAVPPYRPAIVQLGLSELAGDQVQIKAILLLEKGQPLSFSQTLSAERVKRAIRGFQRQLSRQEPINPAAGPGAELSGWLLQPLADVLRASGANALLFAADRGLQAIPFAALPFGDQPLAERFALSVSPSLGLLDLEGERGAAEGLLLAAGASRFQQSLEPLPMVPRELAALAGEQSAMLLMDEQFTVDALRRLAVQERFRQLHIATHADFQPGREDAARLYTPRDSLSLAALRNTLRLRAQERPMDLITLSACHTALGDEQSELGFVGMALQAGARSAIGTLWEVDDAATAAFFIQYYRYLRGGLEKDQALQATARAFRTGAVRLEGEALIGPKVSQGGEALLVRVDSPEERRRLSDGLRHPHYWAGMVLTGSPW